MSPMWILVVCSDYEIFWHEEMRSALEQLGSPTYLPPEQSPWPPADFSLVIVDQEGVEDPAELIQSLRQAYPAAKIVAVSGLPTWKQALTAFESGADDFYKKHYDVDLMLEYLQSVLRRNSHQNGQQVQA